MHLQVNTYGTMERYTSGHGGGEPLMNSHAVVPPAAIAAGKAVGTAAAIAGAYEVGNAI